MDSTIIAAVIGATATLLAVILNHYLSKKQSQSSIAPPETRRNTDIPRQRKRKGTIYFVGRLVLLILLVIVIANVIGVILTILRL